MLDSKEEDNNQGYGSIIVISSDDDEETELVFSPSQEEEEEEEGNDHHAAAMEQTNGNTSATKKSSRIISARTVIFVTSGAVIFIGILVLLILLRSNSAVNNPSVAHVMANNDTAVALPLATSTTITTPSSSAPTTQHGSLESNNNINNNNLLQQPDPTCPSLKWSDEFQDNNNNDDTTSSLNLNNWEYELGDGCDIGLCGWGNNEWQRYTKENVVVSNGILKIRATRDKRTTQDFRQFYSYQSSRIRTIHKADFLYGYFEARIQLPIGRGIWPAFWMMPTDSRHYGIWPKSGEIDIMEGLGQEYSTIHGTVHYSDNPSGNIYHHLWLTKPTNLLEQDRFTDDFHDFAIEWTANSITWYLDGSEYFRVIRKEQQHDDEEFFAGNENVGIVLSRHWPFDRPFHFILNVAVGGNWPGYPDETTIFPQTMQVDYVRVHDVSFGSLHGSRQVESQQQGVRYDLQNGILDYTYEWSVPEGASFSLVVVEDDNNNGSGSNSSILVHFGSTSGYVRVIATSKFCGVSRTFSIPVKVNPFYSFDFTLVNADTSTFHNNDDSNANTENTTPAAAEENTATTTTSLVDASGDYTKIPDTSSSGMDNTNTNDVSECKIVTRRSHSIMDVNDNDHSYDTTNNISGDDDDEDCSNVIQYIRNGDAAYDTISYKTTVIASPNDYIYGKRRFYMNIFNVISSTTTTSTAASSVEYEEEANETNNNDDNNHTRRRRRLTPANSKRKQKILIQLENSQKANPYNYPTGRHSRYEAFLIMDDDDDDDDATTMTLITTTQTNETTTSTTMTAKLVTLPLNLLDQPDEQETFVDTLVVMFDPGKRTNDTYYFHSIDSYHVVAT